MEFSKELDNINDALNTIYAIQSSIGYISKTSGITPISLIGRNGQREIPGFTPNEAYIYQPSDSINDWFGNLLDKHLLVDGQYRSLSTNERFEKSTDLGNLIDTTSDQYQYYSTRDHYLLFNDTSTDYFKHGLQIIDRLNPLRSEKNTNTTWDGYEDGLPFRLGEFEHTPYENTDPTLFGFELIIDAASSPLLNGSVENFIDQFSSISEVGARKYVLYDFKNQFVKLFKTKGTIYFDNSASDHVKTSISTSNYSNTDPNSNIYESGRKAYMSYYLKKIGGLELLIEANTSSKKKYITDYRNDILKLTFNEDVSSSMGTLAYLYKLLYWSKINGKSIIPDNLLRFNCDIIISEVRNLNRVRKAINSDGTIDNGSLEIIKDNVSRHIYSLSECQFYFDQPAHDSEIDIGSDPKIFDQFVVSMDYKLATSKFERWVPDNNDFGVYAGYNNAAIWKIGNKGNRATNNSSIDNSTPAFFSVGENKLNQNGVNTSITLDKYSYSYYSDDEYTDLTKIGSIVNTSIDILTNFKNNSKKVSQILANESRNVNIRELQYKTNNRANLLNNTLNKIRNSSSSSNSNNSNNRSSISNFVGNSVSNEILK